MRSFACAVLLACLVPVPARAKVLDPNFVETDWVVSDELNLATGLAWAPDGSNRLFVARKTGQIRVIKGGQLLATPFATVPRIFMESECGLIGIAFDPDFLANHFLYAFVTVLDESSLPIQRILRYRADGDTGVDQTIV